METERLMLAALVFVMFCVVLGLVAMAVVLIHNHRERRRHDREITHERLTDDEK